MSEPHILRAWNRRWLADWFPEPEPVPTSCRYCELPVKECECESIPVQGCVCEPEENESW